jgi:hypothetical protein
MAIIECIPNVSEGRRSDVIEACATAIRGAGVHLLDVKADASHNRTVYTFAGDAGPVRAAVLALFATALGYRPSHAYGRAPTARRGGRHAVRADRGRHDGGLHGAREGRRR